MGEVASRAFFYRRGEDVAARAEEHPLSFRAERDVFDKVADRNAARSSCEPVIRDVDGNSSVFTGLCVEHMKLAVKLVGYAAVTAGAWPPDIPRFVRGDLCNLASGYVVGIKIEVSV